MQSGKLLQLLGRLSKKELRDFQLYLASPIHNRNKSLEEFYGYLLKYADDFTQSKLSKEAFFKKHYPKTGLDEQKMRYLQSDLTQLLEDFIAWNEFQKDAFQQKYYLAKSHHNRHIDKFFLQELEKITELNNKSVFRDSDYYYNLHRISELNYSYASGNRNRAFDDSLQDLIDNLEITYLARGFRYYCEMINRRNILSVKYNLSFFDDLVQHLKKGTFDDIPAIFVYRIIHESLSEPNAQTYPSLLKALEEFGHLFSKTEERGLYVFAQNFCIKRINAGDSDALRDIFNLYQAMLSKGLLFEGNYISQPDFKNIVTTGLRLEAHDWVGNFIESHKNMLHPSFAENAYTYSMAWVHFSRNELDKALRMLLRVEFNDVYYHLDSKSLLMKVYYEMNEHDAFSSLVDAFKVYLRRNTTISELQKKTYHNFVLICNQLMRAKLNRTPLSTKQKNGLENLRPLADFSWLMAKNDELDRSFSTLNK